MSIGTGAAIFGCEGLTLGTDEAAFFRDYNPFGFIIFARNVETPDQLRRLTSGLRNAVGRDAPIFVDQEGGRVQRLRAPHWREFLPPLDAVQRALAIGGVDAAARMMWLRSRLIADDLRAVGIDGNCAPCADVLTDQTHPFLMNRCYSNDVQAVVKLSREAALGHLAGGVLPVMKHLPGHGRATLDTHLELPKVTATAQSLWERDFAAFKGLADLPLAMTAHIVFTAFDDQPATCSATMIDLIRSEIGFDGLLMTDDLNMQALSGSLGERTARAMAAGCDIALHCKGVLSEMQAVAAEAGEMRPETRRRAEAAIAARIAPQPVDISELDAEHSSLLTG